MHTRRIYAYFYLFLCLALYFSLGDAKSKSSSSSSSNSGKSKSSSSKSSSSSSKTKAKSSFRGVRSRMKGQKCEGTAVEWIVIPIILVLVILIIIALWVGAFFLIRYIIKKRMKQKSQIVPVKNSSPNVIENVRLSYYPKAVENLPFLCFLYFNFRKDNLKVQILQLINQIVK